MFGRRQDPHSSVYLLADHLDAILAAGEDLPRQQLDLRALNDAKSQEEARAANKALRKFVNNIAVSELAITARLRQARLQAKALIKADPRFASLIKLFLGGTAAIVDALDEIGSSDSKTFGHDKDPVSFLRSRALLGEECAGLAGIEILRPGEDMAIAGKIELRGLLDLVAAFLDSLDMAYELYPEEEAPASPQPVTNRVSSAGGSLTSALAALKSTGGTSAN